MTDAEHTFRARVINLCYGIEESCSLTDIQSLKSSAKHLLDYMEVPSKTPTSSVEPESYEDLI